jgi:cell filamentation protein
MADGFGKYDVYAVAGSIYCYADTNVLKNRLGIRNQEQLKQIEADITAIRQNDLLTHPITGRFTPSHLCRIHRYLFSDVYSFAGHYRKEDIMKGTTRFLTHGEISGKLSALLAKLKQESYLQGLSRTQVVQRSAYYFAELNYIHPFREGNGRSTREFMRQLYAQCGYEIVWNSVPVEQLLLAMEESVYRTTALEQVLEACLIEMQ